FDVVLIRRATQQASPSPTTSSQTSTSLAAISTANGTTLSLRGLQNWSSPHQHNRSHNCCTAPKPIRTMASPVFSTKESALCILDGNGKIVRETKLPSDPEIIARFIAKHR